MKPKKIQHEPPKLVKMEQRSGCGLTCSQGSGASDECADGSSASCCCINGTGG
ncbi:MAG TPA: hypothetical protein QGH10_19160 [Armatimonadota bacterium]|nr:hypothetical protein [Armatimonadota bacterium]